MATIEKRTTSTGDTTFRVKVRLKGRPAQTATFSRLTDARKWAKQTEVEIDQGRYFKTAQAKKHTLAEVIDRYKRDVLPRKGAQKAMQGPQLDWWRKEMGAYALADVTPALIAERRDRLLNGPTHQGERRSPATVNRYLAALSHAFTTAGNEWGWVDDNPMRKVKRPTEPRGRVRYLSDDTVLPDGSTVEGERTRLLRACREFSKPYLYPVVVLALSTGMRQGEIMNLRWDEVDLHQGRITLHETKSGERRVVPLVGHALEVLRDHARVRRLDTDMLFPGNKIQQQRDQKPVDLRAAWVSALAKAEIKDFRFHDLRHSAAAYLAMNGASLAEIAEVLGHKTLQMVRRYAHLSETHTAGVVARMNERIFGA